MKSKELTLRYYEASDRNDCLRAFLTNVPEYFTQDEVRDFADFLTRLELKQIATHFYVVVIGSQVLGCGGFGDKNGDGLISLAWGHVHKDYHEKGYGEALLKYRLKAIAELMPKQTVVVDTTQFSFGFFEKFGFKTTKITPDYYALGMHRYDMELIPVIA
jgi:ribosomal protein S18 acetylase RimI-like enzyme